MKDEIRIDTEKFREDGYLAIDGFLTPEEVNELKVECKRLVDEFSADEHQSIFSTKNQKSDDYFMTSGDKIRYFFEEDAFDESGELKVPKERAINKIGHALYELNPVFKRITRSEKVQSVIRQCGMEKPAIVQSMYIFKQPQIGGAVVPHQDSTYLYTEPLNVIGLWIALEDSTAENGCLSFIPGSHKNGTSRRFIRNPDPNGPLTILTGKPLEFDETKFVPAPAKPGTLLLINGEVIHQSEANRSPKSRQIYTFHVVETKDTVYSTENWLQPTPELPFPLLYDD